MSIEDIFIDQNDSEFLVPHPHLLCAAFTGAASLFGVQKVLQRRLPYPLQWNLLVSIGRCKWMMEFKDRETREGTIFFSDNVRLFALSGVVSGKLCDDSLGDTEVFRPVVVPRNRQSP